MAKFEVWRRVEWASGIVYLVLILPLLGGGIAIGVINQRAGKETAAFVVPISASGILSLVLLGMAIASLWGYFFPRRLVVKDDTIIYYEDETRIGQVHLGNVTNIKAHWEEETPNAMAFGGGLLGAMAAMSAAKRKPTTIVIKIRDIEDPETFWPEEMIKKRTVRIKVNWAMPNDEVAKKLERIWLKWDNATPSKRVT